MLTQAELQVLERRRTAPPGIDRASIALLVDRDASAAQREICAEEAEQRRHFERLVPPQPGRFGYSVCSIAALAAYDVLCHSADERNLHALNVAFEPELAGATMNDCGHQEIQVSLTLLAWLAGDEARCASHLARCNPKGLLDALLTEVVSLLVRDQGHQVGEVLARRGPQYVQAVAGGLWKKDPDAFVHIRLLAALRVASERGRLDLRQLPDTIPYVPLWFLAAITSA